MPRQAVTGVMPGWYGKVASLGDFTGRRLAPAFVGPWDAWLQEGMLESRARLGAAWLDLYRHAPVWRFVLARGVCGDAAMAGVLLPGIDRVGRHFPLTLAAPVGDGAGLDALVAGGAAWFDPLACLGVAAMRGELPLAGLDAALEALGPPAPMPPSVPDPGCALLPLDTGHAAAAALARIAPGDGLAGRAAFWTEGTERMAPALLASAGLPPPARFAALLGAGEPPAG